MTAARRQSHVSYDWCPHGTFNPMGCGVCRERRGLVPALTWRAEQPTAPGWYFVRDMAGCVSVVELVEYAPVRSVSVHAAEPVARLVAFESGVAGFAELSQLRAVAWSGPLALPVDGSAR